MICNLGDPIVFATLYQWSYLCLYIHLQRGAHELFFYYFSASSWLQKKISFCRVVRTEEWQERVEQVSNKWNVDFFFPTISFFFVFLFSWYFWQSLLFPHPCSIHTLICADDTAASAHIFRDGGFRITERARGQLLRNTPAVGHEPLHEWQKEKERTRRRKTQ